MWQEVQTVLAAMNSVFVGDLAVDLVLKTCGLRAMAPTFRVVLSSLGGEELCVVDVPHGARASELKHSVARELDLYPYTFKLVAASGLAVEGNGFVRNLAEDGRIELTLVKIDGIPSPDSQGYVQLQAGSATPAQMNYLRIKVLIGILLLLLIGFGRSHYFHRLSKRPGTLRRRRRCLILASYVVYLLEALLFNRSAKGLLRLKPTDRILEYIENIKSCRPAPELNAQCYHMETHTQDVANEDGTIDTQTYEVRVDTTRFTEVLTVSHWVDVTGDVMYGLRYFPLLQVHFEVICETADEATRRTHDQQRQALNLRAQAADDSHDISETLRLIDEDGRDCSFCSDMIGINGSSSPWWLSYFRYAICSFLGLSWPYRYYLSQQAVKGNLIFRKRVWSHMPHS